MSLRGWVLRDRSNRFRLVVGCYVIGAVDVARWLGAT